jgi:hypothetical protein
MSGIWSEFLIICQTRKVRLGGIFKMICILTRIYEGKTWHEIVTPDELCLSLSPDHLLIRFHRHDQIIEKQQPTIQ